VQIAVILINEGNSPYTEWVSIPTGTDRVLERGTFNETGSTLTVEFAGSVLAGATHDAGDCAAASTTTASPEVTIAPTTTTAAQDANPPTAAATTTTVVAGDSGTVPTTAAVTTTTPPMGGQLPATGTASTSIVLLAGVALAAGVGLRIFARSRS
jgi:LPXTG-motif cell wall-anchored protein